MIRLENVSKVYRTERVETLALDNVNLSVAPGELVSVMGPLRQEHPAQPDGPPGRAQRGLGSTARRSRPTGTASSPA